MGLIDNFIKHRFKDSWINLTTNIKNSFWADKYKGTERYIEPPKGYETVFVDEFKEALSQEKWRYAHPWGDFHPANLTQYYDNNGTLSYVSTEGLVLELRKAPKKIIKANLPDWRQSPNMPDEFVIPVGVGLITTREAWQYGWFEGWIKLPKGQSYWNAFWTTGLKTWPPEIDIFEAYSDEGPNYDKGQTRCRKIQPNLHYGRIEEGTKKMYGSYNNTVAGATDRFVQYVCHWEKDFIKIYYDGKQVFQCTDPKILKWFNASDAHQYIVIGHGLHERHPENPYESAMLVRSFKVYQRK
jgi:hypothetical protein